MKQKFLIEVFQSKVDESLYTIFKIKNCRIYTDTVTDTAFIVENNISEIFRLLDKFIMKVDLIQNSAISFSVCINDKYNSLDQLIS